jgi:Holliday junction resolvasome RuvABC endonuclease subunit
MTRILGLDLSCASTGVALPTGRTITLSPSSTLGVAPRIHWIAGSIARIVRVYDPQVAVVEDYAPHSVGILSTIRLAEVGGAVRMMLYELGLPYLNVRPNTLKRYATGNGNAPKERMILAASVGGASPRNHDEADAWLLRALGLHGFDGRELLDGHGDRKARLEVIAAIDWPEPRP